MEIPLNAQKADLLEKSHHKKCLIFTLLVLYCVMASRNCDTTSSSSSVYSGYSGSSSYPGSSSYTGSSSSTGSSSNTGYTSSQSKCTMFVAFPLSSIIGAILYFVYLFDCCGSGSSSYVSNEMTVSEFANYMKATKNSAPRIGIGMECYHIKVTREYTTTKWSDGSKTTEQTGKTKQKIVTWRGEADFDYRAWDDITGEIIGIDGKKFTKLRLEKDYLFETTEGAQRFANYKKNFIDANKNRDIEYDVYPIFEIPGHRDRVFLRAEGVEKPFLLNSFWYWIASLCLLSWPYRMWFEYLAESRRATIRKLIYI